MRPARTTLLALLVGTSCVAPAPESPPDARGSPAPDAGPAPAPDAAPDAAPRDAGALDAGEIADATVDAGSVVPDAGGPASSGGCGRAAPAAGEWALEHGGRTRTFLVHVPADYDPSAPTPVVLDMHGRAFTAQAQRALTGMDELADVEGFVAVHPQGVGRTWNAGLCCGEAMREGVDDVGFVAAMLDALEAELCVDRRRVFVTGLSNGGFIAHRLACELSDRIAAIAPVAGVLTVGDCVPARPVPVLHFHGDDDQVVRYEGYGGYLSAEASCEGWAARNGCDATSQVTFSEDDVECRTWAGCAEGAEVRLCTIAGGGHTWPGGAPLPLLGRTTQTVSASRWAWTFFEAHPMP